LDKAESWLDGLLGKEVRAAPIYTDASDGYVGLSGEASWAAIRGASTGNFVDDTDDQASNPIAAQESKGSYAAYRSFFRYDVSAISGTVTAVSNVYTGWTCADSSVSVQQGTFADTLVLGSFDDFSGSAWDNVEWTIGANTFTYDSAGIAAMQTTVDGDNNFKVVLREYTYDYLGSEPSTVNNGMKFAESDDDPYLEITLDQSGVKVNTPLTNKLTDGLVGHWTFDGQDIDWSTNTVYDRSGQGNDGEITNMNTSTAAVRGKSGQALEFDGTNDYIQLDSNIIVIGEFSVTAWVKPVDLDPGTESITFFGSDNGENRIGFTETIFVIECNDDFRFDMSLSEPLTEKEWQFFAIIREPDDNTYAYRNGVLIASLIQAEDCTFSTIGSVPDGYMDGTLDEVRVYDRALSAGEIGELYRAGARKIVR